MTLLLNIHGRTIDADKQLMELDRIEYEDSLYLFLKAAWEHIPVPDEFTDGWAMQAIAEHLEAVVDGQIKRLMIHVPPRTGKTNLCSVALPAWTWAQRNRTQTSGPGVRFMYASYGESLSMEHSVHCRRLIKSEWYQEMWGKRFTLMNDQDTKHKFSNDKGGERQITSIDARVTGRGGDIILIDDPNATNEAFSEAKINSVNTWWNETMLSRLNNRKTGAFVVIQQRIAENDLSGHILETSGEHWDHLMLPMRFERDRTVTTSIGWSDPRVEEGDLLWPERFDEADVKAIERESTPFVFAGQYQQRPEPKGGGVIKREWWLNWKETDYPPMDYIIASVDTAYTEKTENDYSAITIWGVFTQDPVAVASRTIDQDGRPVYIDRTFAEQTPRVMLMHAWQGRLELHDLVVELAKAAKKFKIDKMLVEAKASGHSVAQEIRRLYGHEDWAVQLVDPKSQDKLARLYSCQHIWADGLIYAPDRAWADMVITQVAQFPRSRHDDLTDTCSMGIRHLRDIGILVRSQERLSEIEQMKVLTHAPAPLYPG